MRALFTLNKIDTDVASWTSYSDTITVTVGEDHHRFSVHKEKIRGCSTFFEKACSRLWMGRTDKTIELPEVQPRHFAVYLDWVYSNEADLRKLSGTHLDKWPSMIMEDGATAENMVLTGVWMLGDFLGDAKLKNAIMDTLMERESSQPSFLPVAQAYKVIKDTPSDCSLQRWVLNEVARSFESDDIKALMPQLSTSLQSELLNRVLDVRRPVRAPCKTDRWSTRCKYHEHAEGEPKCR